MWRKSVARRSANVVFVIAHRLSLNNCDFDVQNVGSFDAQHVLENSDNHQPQFELTICHLVHIICTFDDFNNTNYQLQVKTSFGQCIGRIRRFPMSVQ